MDVNFNKKNKCIFVLMAIVFHIKGDEIDVGFFRGLMKTPSVIDFYEREIRKIDRRISKLDIRNDLIEWIKFKDLYLYTTRRGFDLRCIMNNATPQTRVENHLKVTYYLKREFYRILKSNNGPRFASNHAVRVWLVMDK